jgi:hypothetical protein
MNRFGISMRRVGVPHMRISHDPATARTLVGHCAAAASGAL